MRKALLPLGTHAEKKTSTSTCTAEFLHGVSWCFDSAHQPGQSIVINSKTGYQTVIVDRDLDGKRGILLFDEAIPTNGRYTVHLRSNGAGWHLCRCALFVS